MDAKVPVREEAFALLKQYNKNESLIKHALAVEGVMRYMARKRGEDEEKWGIIGLIHDLDYEQFPDQHCTKTAEILATNQWPRDYIRAVVSHGWGICSDVQPESELEKVLYAVDELTGLVATSALVRPSKSVLDLTAKSVQKKWKDKRFAAAVNRDQIRACEDQLGIELGEFIQRVGLGTFLEQIGLDPVPEMVSHPRTNPYIFFQDEVIEQGAR